MLAMGLGSAQAYSTNFGQDLNGDPGVALADIPKSSAAETSFLSKLTGAGTETFESLTVGATGPISLTFPGSGGTTLTATLNGGNGSVASVAEPGTTDGFGRFSVPSATSSQYWQVTVTDGSGTGTGAGIADFTVTFSQDMAAFGFYGIDIGDFGGTLSVELLDDAGNVVGSLAVGNDTTTAADGSVLFFGLVASSTSELFRSIRFVTAPGFSPDAFAFDNFSIADACQAGISCGSTGGGGGGVPEPASLALVAGALLSLRLASRRRA